MSKVSRRTLMLAVALLAVLAAVLIVALGGDHPHNGRGGAAKAGGAKSATRAAADYLGLGTSVVRRRLRNGETLEEIAESTPGHSPQGLLRTVTAARTAELRAQGLSQTEVRAGVRKLRARLRAQLRRKRRSGATIASASAYLGISEAQLRKELRSGNSPVQVAAAHGISRTQLIEGIVKRREGALVRARKAGQISAAEEKTAIKLLRRKVARAVEAKNL